MKPTLYRPAISTTTLIAPGDTRRDFGVDTLNASLGKIGHNSDDVDAPKPSKFKMKLCPEDCRGIISGVERLDQLQRKHEGAQLVTHRTRGHAVQYRIETTIITAPLVQDRDGNAEPLSRNETFKAKLRVFHVNDRSTDMVVKVFRDRNGHYWLGVYANPTALLNGYNAFAVAFADTGVHQERRRLQRVPFFVLRRIIRSVMADFDWHADTKQRIRELSFRNAPAQLFTYLVTAPHTPEKIMGFLRCVYATPYHTDVHGYRLLSDDLGIEVHSRQEDGGLQSLLFVFRKDERVTWSMCLYDKLAKARWDAKTINASVGDKASINFLRSAVRADITIHGGGQREMFSEGHQLNQKACNVTTAEYCNSIELMDDGEGRSGKKFVGWMLDHIFEEHLKLWSLLDYSPKKLEKARRKLEEYNHEAAAAFAEWQSRGFEFVPEGSKNKRGISFVQFLEFEATSNVSRDVARRARGKLMEMKLDPDIPLRAYDAFFLQTFIWNLSDEQRHQLAVAQEAGDVETANALQQRSRANSLETAREIITAFGTMIKGAYVPANTLGATDNDG